jgi:hypothetical protein
MRIGLLLLFTISFWARPLLLEAQNKLFGFHLMDKRKSIRIPFELHANLVIIPAVINDSDTLHFILDTGVSSTIITDPEVSRFINTRYVRSIQLDGVGRDSTVQAQISIGNTLRVGYARIFEHNLVVLEKDILRLSELVGTPIHGIIGYELFERFVITLDFRHRELLIRLPDRYKYRRADGEKMPLDIIEKKPYLDGILIGEKGKQQRVRLLLDTGAGHAVMLNTYATDLPMPDTTIDVQLGIGLSGKISGHLGRLDQVVVGSHHLTQVVASFPDSASFGSKISNRELRQGNIGGELLRRFVVTINYPEGFMTMKPIKKAMKETFEHDMSGMDLRARGARYNEYYVDKVIDDSPAYHAGLEKDDRLLFINNTAASTLNMTEIYKLLQRREGREINLIVQRNGNVIFTSLILKRII